MELGVDCNLQLAASRRMVLLSSAPGSKSPLGRGGGATHHALGVLSVFPVVSVRLCEERVDKLEEDLDPAARTRYQVVEVLHFMDGRRDVRECERSLA